MSISTIYINGSKRDEFKTEYHTQSVLTLQLSRVVNGSCLGSRYFFKLTNKISRENISIVPDDYSRILGIPWNSDRPVEHY